MYPVTYILLNLDAMTKLHTKLYVILPSHFEGAWTWLLVPYWGLGSATSPLPRLWCHGQDRLNKNIVVPEYISQMKEISTPVAQLFHKQERTIFLLFILDF